jgi:hypothetical protein
VSASALITLADPSDSPLNRESSDAIFAIFLNTATVRIERYRTLKFGINVFSRQV